MSIDPIKSSDFDALRLRLASPEVIREWSHGEIIRPETINYRTQRPEKDGLFCERIFGPSKDWECYCGKYKKIRYKGIVCDKCGVEVTRSLVRRERMGHIELKAPVTHIWFLRGVPSKIGMVLNLSVQNLEKIVYFANFIITKVDEELKETTLEQIKQEFKSKKKQIENEINQQIQVAKSREQKDVPAEKPAEAEEQGEKKDPSISSPQPEPRDEVGTKAAPGEKKEESKKGKEGVTKTDQEVVDFNKLKEQRVSELEEALDQAEKELKDLKVLNILSETSYQDLSLKYGHVFEASIGAEAIKELLKMVDIDALTAEVEEECGSSSGLKKEKLMRRLKLIKNFQKNIIDPHWMVLEVVPVIPPDLRPMVPLDGGRFATSDLNDLYRRVINRNNRLKQLMELNAPEVITRNEKRMLQEAVDALIDNSARHGKTVTASTGQKRMLKSIADMLKGKQGRFRQNLLGKRTDYSGRSVIVIGPELKLDECGIPKIMALELFKPFIISQLIKGEFVHNVRSANRFIESGRSEVWDILENITKNTYVFLNRAPTLHRLGIQAFKPILIEGKAIRIHPMVCTGFNADFDGDQMAVHVPLTREAVREAKEIMLATKNLLKPATGEPEVRPNQDIVWASYYLTQIHKDDDLDEDKVKYFCSENEALLSYNLGYIKLQQLIRVRIAKEKGKTVLTSAGRLLFNKVIPAKLPFVNELTDKKVLGRLVGESLDECGEETTVVFLDSLKHLCFTFLTKSGLSWGMNDLPNVPQNKEIIKEAENTVDAIQEQYEEGLLTQSERRSKVIETWNITKEKVEKVSVAALSERGPVYSMIKSGARGTITQLVQIIGMKGPVANPSGKIIELPVKGNFKRGFDVLEFFISTHGTRKGLADTALRTANAGYLTRRLIDVAQDVVILEKDCGDKEGIVIDKKETDEMGEQMSGRVAGRFVINKVVDPKTKKTIIPAGTLVDKKLAREFDNYEDIKKILVRSMLTCKTKRGGCQKCYGFDLGANKMVEPGTAVGIIAAQSIGEPGTQLTMRTFHTGGVAGVSDITQGLPRVEEIFEVRPPKRKAFVTDVAGMVSIEEGQKSIQDEHGNLILKGVAGQKIIKIRYDDIEEDEYKLPKDLRSTAKAKKPKSVMKVKEGDKVKKNEVLVMLENDNEVKAKRAGFVKIDDKKITIVVEAEKDEEYVIPKGYIVWVKDGQMVERGDQLTEGSLDLKQLYRLKGQEAVQKYILKEIQYIYSSQGQKLNDKHVEIIIRQLFSRVYVKDAGGTNLLPGDIVEIGVFMGENEKAEKDKKEVAKGEILLQGISKTALSTESFLSSASFQETQRVLTTAAVTGKVDYLRGLKENVIIGRLIPAGTGYKANQKAEVPTKKKEDVVSEDDVSGEEEEKGKDEEKTQKAKETKE